MCVVERDGKVVITDQTERIAKLEAQIAVLKMIIEWERASRLRDQVEYETEDEMMSIFCYNARGQLAEEYPEIFGD